MAESLAGLDTFPKLLMHHARVRPARPAIREKDLGIWQTWSWARFADEVRALACGLAAQGFKRGDHRDLHLYQHSFPSRRSSDLKQLIPNAALFQIGRAHV